MLIPRLATIAEKLFDVGAIKIDTEKGFKLKLHERNPEAPYSPIFLNLRTPENPKPGPLTQEIVNLIAYEMFNLILAQNIRPDIICGIPRAGEPFVDTIERLYKKSAKPPVRILLDKHEADGKREIIVDPHQDVPQSRGMVAAMFDDLITEADSKKEARDALTSLNYIVRYLFVFLDREQGGSAEMERIGIQTRSVIRITKLIAWAKAEGRIPPGNADFIADYIMGKRPGVIHA